MKFIIFILLTLISISTFASNCKCSDQKGKNFVIINYDGKCEDLQNAGDAVNLSQDTQPTGNTTCSNSKLDNQPFSCGYTLSRIHISSCTSAD